MDSDKVYNIVFAYVWIVNLAGYLSIWIGSYSELQALVDRRPEIIFTFSITIHFIAVFVCFSILSCRKLRFTIRHGIIYLIMLVYTSCVAVCVALELGYLPIHTNYFDIPTHAIQYDKWLRIANVFVFPLLFLFELYLIVCYFSRFRIVTVYKKKNLQIENDVDTQKDPASIVIAA